MVALSAPLTAERLAAQSRWDERAAVPLATLFAAPWPQGVGLLDVLCAEPAAVMRVGEPTAYDLWSVERPQRVGRAGRASRQAEAEVAAGRALAAQATSVLTFLRERDPAFVAALPAGLAAGRSVAELLAASPTLPHDLDALDAVWRKWMRARPAAERRGDDLRQ
jgi:hypothetical protein